MFGNYACTAGCHNFIVALVSHIESLVRKPEFSANFIQS